MGETTAYEVDLEIERPRWTPLEELTFATVDLETTGVDFERDRIVEIAIVRSDVEGRVLGEFSTLVDPECAVGASEIHGITDTDVAGAPRFRDLIGLIGRQLSGAVMVAHNCHFERSFLNASLFREIGRRLSTPYICTQLMPGGGGSLASCLDRYGIELDNAHRALDDARATAGLVAAELGAAGVGSLNGLVGDEIGQVRSDDWMARSWRRPFIKYDCPGVELKPRAVLVPA